MTRISNLYERITSPRTFPGFVNRVKSAGLTRISITYETRREMLDEENNSVIYSSFIELIAGTIKLEMPVYSLPGPNHTENSGEENLVNRAALLESIRIGEKLNKLGLETRINNEILDATKKVLESSRKSPENKYVDLFLDQYSDLLPLTKEYRTE